MPEQAAADKSGVASASPSSGGQPFAPLAFDESLVSDAQTATTASLSSSKSATDFFLDQIAAVVSDEKKLSDNIMDLIPPVEAPRSEPAVSLSMPLQPPPGLLTALSPPTSLLPDFGDVTPLSLLSDASTTSSAIGMSIPATTTVTTAVKRELPVVKPAAATTAMRRKSETAINANKKQKTENVKSDTTKTAPTLHQLQQQQARHHLHGNAALNAAAAAAAAREKVMKEPQSGDLYECVITKRNGGLGLTLACVDDHVQITGLAPDTPAANSGICVGDTLVAVSGLPVRGLQFSTVIGRLKSTSRNSVVLKLRRNPFRQNAGNASAYRAIKRPGRGPLKGSDSTNSANVLSSKTMALETRLGGGLNGSLGGASNGSTAAVDDNRSHTQSVANAASLHQAHHLQMQLKTEPMNSTYFPTDASILTMGVAAASAVPPSTLAPSSTVPSDTQTGFRVALEEKDRYHAECRALRHELARAIVAQRVQKRESDAHIAQLQTIVDKFQQEVKALLPEADTNTAAATATPATANTEDIAALRQKLVEAKQALAKQQAEMLTLQERESRHALPDAQRVKWQLVSRMRKSVLQIDCKAALQASPVGAVKIVGQQEPLAFDERLDGVRPSAFALLVGQESCKSGSTDVELKLDAKACAELLGWNLREVVVQAGKTYSVSVMDAVHIKYMRAEEALIASWTLSVNDTNK